MKKLIVLIGVIFSFIGISNAKIPKPQKNTYVNDFAGILKPAQIASLNEKIHRIERLSTVQVAIVLINKVPDEYDIEDYTLLIGRKWHVGKNKNGFVYVAAIDQRKQRIEVGRNLNNKLDNEKCAELLNSMKPFFKAQDYNGGLQNLVSELGDQLAPSEPVTNASPARTTQHVAHPAKKESNNGVLFIVGIFIAAVVIYFIARIVRPRTPVYVQPQQPLYGGNGYGGNYPPHGGVNINNFGGGSGSGIGSGVGGFVAGAATGYAVRAIQDRLDDDDDRHDNHHDHYVTDDDRDQEEDTTDTERDDDPTDYGNWGDNSSSSDNDDDDSSSDSGFDGDRGATSDW